MKNNNPFISLKIVNKQTGKILRTSSHKSRHIFYFFKADKFKDCVFKVSVRYKDGSKNEGEYQNKKDAIYALRAFLE